LLITIPLLHCGTGADFLNFFPFPLLITIPLLRCGIVADVYPSSSDIPLLITIPPLLYTHLLPPSEVWNNPDQAACW
jgi:hypothetical protein